MKRGQIGEMADEKLCKIEHGTPLTAAALVHPLVQQEVQLFREFPLALEAVVAFRVHAHSSVPACVLLERVQRIRLHRAHGAFVALRLHVVAYVLPNFVHVPVVLGAALQIAVGVVVLEVVLLGV